MAEAAAAPAPKPPISAQAAQVLTADGWGPLRIGMSRAEVVEALGPDANPEAVGGPDPERCDEFRPVEAPEGMRVMIEDGRLTRISLIEGSQVVVERGAGIGATADEVRAAYGPGTTVTEPHQYVGPPGEYITAWRSGPSRDPAGDRKARGIRYVFGADGRVAEIHAGGQSIQYVEGCV